jgi:hypothetical protein
MDGFEIHDGGCASDVEEVFPNTDIASAPPLLTAQVCEPMLDGDSFAEAFTALGSCDEFAQAMLQPLVLADADGSTRSRRRHGADGAQGATGARFGIELHDGAGLESLDHTGGTTNRVRPHVDVEVGLGEELAVARNPGLADHFAASFEHVLNKGAADVAAINMQLGDDVAAGQVGNVIAKHGSRFFFRTIRISLSSTETRRSAATPWRMREPPPEGSGSRSWSRIWRSVAR